MNNSLRTMSYAAAYLNLKLAHELFQKQVDELRPEEKQRVAEVANRQQQLEQLILASAMAARVAVPETSVDSAFKEVQVRYAQREEFLADLSRIGLDEQGLRSAIERDMKVETILDKVGADIEPVSDTEVEIFYLTNLERFRRAETRSLRHILITFDKNAGSEKREQAHAQLTQIGRQLAAQPERFEELALRHSECPTAMNGGLLGQVKRGQLYPELEPAAFALRAGELSAICESPVGYHLLRCDALSADSHAPLDAAREQIRDHLESQRRSQRQKDWIKSLRIMQHP